MRTLQKAPDKPDSGKPDSVSEPPASKVAPLSQKPSGFRSIFADGVFRSLVTACAVCVVAIVGLIVFELISASGPALHKFGFKFLVESVWNPVTDEFGAMPVIYGTIVSSILALLLAVPLSMGTALFITELCPRRLRTALSTCVEMLAAIPSVIYGLWGIFVLVPLLREHVAPLLKKYLGWTGFFEGTMYGFSMLAAGIILAIMILPIVASITREVIIAVPQPQREAALALGATRWEMLRVAVLRNARTGIFGAVILGLGRAMGETMAVTMVIGNTAQISRSLFAPGYTLASVIANEFSEAVGPIHTAALVELGLVLFVVSMLVNALAQLLVWSVTRGMPARNIA